MDRFTFSKPFFQTISKLSLVAIFATGLFASSEFEKKYYTKAKKTNSFLIPIDGLSDEEFDQFILGKSFFRIPWVEAPSATTARDGLGPLFSANTCTSCHPNNSIGKVYNDKKDISRTLVTRLSIPSNNSKKHKELLRTAGFIPEPTYGSQVSINSVFGVPYEAKPHINYEEIRVELKDKEIVTLLKPTITLKNLQYGKLHPNTSFSHRKAPALVGLGLIEMIPNSQILANEDIKDKDGDGISGKANMVYSPITKKMELGKYTYKASAPTVIHQVAAAFNNDMSLTSPLFPNENCTDAQKECKNAPKGRDEFDVPMKRLEAISFYLKNTKTPRSGQEKEGKEIFNSIGCVKCHVDNFTSKNGDRIAPYSDFLLHDMGEGLSDNRSEFLANKTEWRTTPLWGLSSYKATSKDEVRYLHDGRARNLKEAILWHCGEAKQAKENFKNLPKIQREKLIQFIGNL